MKINIFKITDANLNGLIEDLLTNGYDVSADMEDEHGHITLYVQKKHSESNAWLQYYRTIIPEDEYGEIMSGLGSNTLSGAFIIETNSYNYVIAHGQAHFIIRKYCDKDFGLDLAERIVDSHGLKMKHSQTFTSASKKDITSYIGRRGMEASQEYGEAFSYVKCKTVNKEEWGDSADFGESVRFSLGEEFHFTPMNMYAFTDKINNSLALEPNISLPRYRKVTDRAIIDHLQNELETNFAMLLEHVDIDDYWLTGVSFNFSNDYRYALRFGHTQISDIIDIIDVPIIRQIVMNNAELIGTNYDKIRVYYYDENEEFVSKKDLLDLIQVTLEYNGKYYVLIRNKWMEFSESYIAYIKDQVDSIPFEMKEYRDKTEDELIEELISTGQYKKLHKNNVYIKGFCIEKADLMDDDNVIMIKDGRNTSDYVYLVKQATTSMRLSKNGELQENVFAGHNVCLWMILKRKKLNKISDLKSFHLLDAINDFKREVNSMNLSPFIWISLKS